jgi:hypothetical protein
MASSTARLGARALAMAGALAALTGSAAEAYVGGPGNGKRMVTDRPDATGVTVLDGTRDGLDNTVRYCFDVTLQRVANPQGFFIHTYDSGRFMRARTAAIDSEPSRNNCVVAIFDDEQDVGEGTVATIADNAVFDSANRGNPQNAEPLAGSRATPVGGRSTGPDLIGVATRPDQSQATFVFDEQLDERAINDFGDCNPADGVQPCNGPAEVAGRFFYETDASDAGTDIVAGATIVTGKASGNRITVQFGPGMAQAKRFGYFGAGPHPTVYPRDLPQFSGGATNAPPGTFGGNSSGRPALTGAVRVSEDQYELGYDRPIGPTTRPGRILAITDDGEFRAATEAFKRPGTDNSVLAKFPLDLTEDPGAIVRIVDFFGGATSPDAAPLPSVLGVAETAVPNNTPGFTNGPDFLRAARDTNNQVTYTFDEAVDRTVANAFITMTRSGTAVGTAPGSSPSVVRENVRWTFPTTVGSTSGAGLGYGNVVDANGNPGIVGLVDFELEPFPVQPQQQAPPAVVQPSGTAGPVPAVRRTKFASTVTLRREGRASRRKYSGRVTSAGRGCRSGRRVVIKRRLRGGRSRTVTSVFTKGDGTFVLRRKRIPGRVYAFVTERGGRTVFCSSGTSRAIRG